eukprot:TRINITY_DN12010_c0_g1_i2.p1 TRINITY_DN12010_c0_g1~~TRINITY_DN12010_c0_g1_i2.p1  ORF type:complete len:1534 (+),score=423.35 TRINITY_DN12010_c0_g1_i2:75-4676(+)
MSQAQRRSKRAKYLGSDLEEEEDDGSQSEAEVATQDKTQHRAQRKAATRARGKLKQPQWRNAEDSDTDVDEMLEDENVDRDANYEPNEAADDDSDESDNSDRAQSGDELFAIGATRRRRIIKAKPTPVEPSMPREGTRRSSRRTASATRDKLRQQAEVEQSQIHQNDDDLFGQCIASDNDGDNKAPQHSQAAQETDVGSSGGDDSDDSDANSDADDTTASKSGQQGGGKDADDEDAGKGSFRVSTPAGPGPAAQDSSDDEPVATQRGGHHVLLEDEEEDDDGGGGGDDDDGDNDEGDGEDKPVGPAQTARPSGGSSSSAGPHDHEGAAVTSTGAQQTSKKVVKDDNDDNADGPDSNEDHTASAANDEEVEDGEDSKFWKYHDLGSNLNRVTSLVPEINRYNHDTTGYEDMKGFLVDEDEHGDDGGLADVAVVSSVPEQKTPKRRRHSSGKRLLSSADKEELASKRAKQRQAKTKPDFDDESGDERVMRPRSRGPTGESADQNDMNDEDDEVVPTQTSKKKSLRIIDSDDETRLPPPPGMPSFTSSSDDDDDDANNDKPSSTSPPKRALLAKPKRKKKKKLINGSPSSITSPAVSSPAAALSQDSVASMPGRGARSKRLAKKNIQRSLDHQLRSQLTNTQSSKTASQARDEILQYYDEEYDLVADDSDEKDDNAKDEPGDGNQAKLEIVNEAVDSDDDRQNVVNCICQRDTDNYVGPFIQCRSELCEKWQHASCFGYVKATDAKRERHHFCHECSNRTRADFEAVLMPPIVAKLYQAVDNNDLDTVVDIIDQTGQADYCSFLHDGMTPLLLACSKGHTRIALHLLKSKASIRYVDLNNYNAVYHACKGNHSDLLKMLLQKAPDSVWQPVGDTNLCHAAAEGNAAACMQVLFIHPTTKRSARQWSLAQNANYMVPILLAAAKGSAEAFKALLPYSDALETLHDAEGMRGLHIAAEGGSAAIINTCLQACSSQMEARDNRQFTPLMVACHHGHSEAAAALIKAGANVQCKDDERTTPLHLAALAGSTACVKLLLKNGHPIVALDGGGWPPLLYADFNARRECVHALLEPAPQQLMYLGILMQSGHQDQRDKMRERAVSILTTIATEETYYRYINDLLRAKPSLLDHEFAFLLEFKGLVDVDIKLEHVKKRMRESFAGRYPSMTRLTIDRKHIFESAHYNMAKNPSCPRHLDVTFRNEAGICLGPRREFYHLLGADVCREDLGLMQPLEHDESLVRFQSFFNEHGQSIIETPRYADRARQLKTLGELLAYAICEGDTTHVPLAPYLLDQLFGEVEASLERLEEYDGELAVHLTWLLENDVEGLDLDATVTVKTIDGIPVAIPMLDSVNVASSDDDDQKIPVITNDNKTSYVNQVATFRLIRQHDLELEALRAGFARVDPDRHLKIFSGAELGLLINGQTDLEVDAWQQHTEYRGYTNTSQTIVWFWQALHELTQNERAMLLQFVTGSSRLPAAGFAGLTGLSSTSGMTIARGINQYSLPTASTCFNLLKLPAYRSFEELKQKLLIAIRYGSQGFTFS